MINLNKIFKITITTNYTLQYYLIDSQNQNNKKQLQIENYDINYDIKFLQDLFEQPNEYKEYKITNQNKEYSVIAEVILSLITNEIKQQIEKDYIIEDTIIDLPNSTNNDLLLQRIKISLQAINLKGVIIEDDEEINYNYEQQGDILNELLEQKNEYKKYQQLLKRAEQFTQSEEQQNKLKQIQSKVYSEETFDKEISKSFSLKERSSLKLCQLDNYCLFIASRFLDTIEDHHNITLISRRMKRNGEKFHYNPISVTDKIISFFPNIETLHIYQKEDEYLECGRIQQYVDWSPKCLFQIEKIEKKCDFKYIVYSAKDTEHLIEDEEIVIPDGVKEIQDYSFRWCCKLKKLTIPESVEKLSSLNLGRCSNLQTLILPLNETRIIYGDKIFTTHNNHFKELIYLPFSIMWINDIELCYLTALTIPSTITSISQNALYYCRELQELVIPESVQSIPTECMQYNSKLTKITCPLQQNEMIIGNKIFKIEDNHFKQTIYLSNDIQIINGKEVEKLTSLKIPSTITSIDENCFHDYSHEIRQLSLPKIFLPKLSKIINKLYQLEELLIPIDFTCFKYKSFYEMNGCLHFIEFPSQLKKVNESESVSTQQLETFTIPTNVTKLSDYCFADSEYLTEIKGIENIKEFGKGCFVNCPSLNKEKNSLIQKNYNEYLNQLISEDEMKQLENWTSSKFNEIIFNSENDDYKSVLNKKIIGKSKLFFIIEDENGEIFGYYLHDEVVEKLDEYNIYSRTKTVKESFQFILKTKNDKINQPMKFDIKDTLLGGYCLIDPQKSQLIRLGNIDLFKINSGNNSIHHKFMSRIDYHGMEKDLFGVGVNEIHFIPKRIVVIQMK